MPPRKARRPAGITRAQWQLRGISELPKTPGYLLKENKKSAAHIWTGTDTVCRMASTGGIKISSYIFATTDSGKPVCQNCLNVARIEGLDISGLESTVDRDELDEITSEYLAIMKD